MATAKTTGKSTTASRKVTKTAQPKSTQATSRQTASRTQDTNKSGSSMGKTATSTSSATSKKSNMTDEKTTKASAANKKEDSKGASGKSQAASTAHEDTGKKVSAKRNAAKDLNDLFEDALKDMYWAENAIHKALPTMISNATSETLKRALEDHRKETKDQIDRLDKVFHLLDMKPKGEKCDAMAGILEEGEGILEETQTGSVRDAGIIAACQKVEHYEIATYGTMVAFAKQLGQKEIAKILKSILDEEYNANNKLTDLAVERINKEADNQ